MANCKDCICYESCKDWAEQYEDKEFPYRECSFFKPKADVVEVVRCKDCRSWEEVGVDPITSYRFGYCRHYQWQDREYSDRETNDNDFCSYGERKEK